MLRDKLSRFESQIKAIGNRSDNDERPDRYQTAQKLLGGDIKNLSSGTFLKISSDFDKTYKHGNLTLENLNSFEPYRYLHFDKYGDEHQINPEKLLFFDMETTGLGGSGTVAFLIGLGSVIGDLFQVRQYFLPDYPDEAAMLEAVREEFDEETIVVSYNGRSFDMPILTDRMIINRVERNLKFAGHIDLLHSTRRLYRRRLKSCTLSNIEKNILDFIRYDDIPGELVPAVYFNWLNEMGTELLAQVVEHNLNDIVSLYFLMYHIAQSQENPAERLIDADDIYSVARIYENRRQFDKVRDTLDECKNILPGGSDPDLMFMLSLANKRTGRFDEAAKIWSDISQNSSQKAYPALIELAKYYEHRIKDLTSALDFARKAQTICPARKSDREDIKRRIARLNRKMTPRSL